MTTSSAKSPLRTQTPRLRGRPTCGRGRRFGRTDHRLRMAPSATHSHGTTRARGVRVHWARTKRSTALSCTPFIVLCSRFSKNPAARRLPSSQMPRQPYRGLHPTHQAQDRDTLSRSYNRHYGSNEESPPNSDGSPALQAPPATKRPASG